MTSAKIESKLSAAAQAGLEPYVQSLYSNPGKWVVGVVGLRHTERTEVADGEDKEPAVKLRIAHLELARPEQEEALRQALSALYVHRTAYGTLTEDGELELSEDTLEATAGILHAREAARLRAAVAHWLVFARKTYTAADKPDASLAAIRYDIGLLADGLAKALESVEPVEDVEGEG